LLASAVLPAPLLAQSSGLVVEQRNGDITILDNGSIAFVETWDVQFPDEPFTFISREIPRKHLETISDWEIREGNQVYTPSEPSSDDKQAGTFTVTTTEQSIKITWFFHPTANASRTFTLRYTIQGGLAIGDEHDQFRWQFIEPYRIYPIQAAHVVVHLPADFDVEDLDVSTYRYLDLPEEANIEDGQTVVFAAESFRPGDEWELRVGFPHGVVPAEPPAWQQAEAARQQEEAALRAEIETRTRQYNQVSVGAAGIVLIGSLAALAVVWGRYVRRPAPTHGAGHQPMPPDTLSPLLAGTLLDGRVEMRHIAAALVDLAQRGYVRIGVHKHPQEEEPGLVLELLEPSAAATGSGEKGKSATDLAPYETTLLQAIFGAQAANAGQMGPVVRDSVSLHGRVLRRMVVLKNDIYAVLNQQGYIIENPESLRSRYTTIGLIVLVVGTILAELGASIGASFHAPLAFLVLAALLPFGAGSLLLSRFMHAQTPQGAAAATRWRGFKRYLTEREPETGHQHMPEGNHEQGEPYLPYAIAFGVQQQWVRGRANVPLPAWYGVGNDGEAADEGREVSATHLLTVVQQLVAALEKGG
jgi:uncharacterized membrane protein